ncbi:hypothetical protein F2Q69_00056420 [Brassica cretica]|uniref:Uncharacterized protein n=1 Tax=Brassica cretica TaxID=69181 RepID=A0A8S9MZH4_BRACR|nr:hypothetical protein F2Q69_00056420 [Brassica cretica]
MSAAATMHMPREGSNYDEISMQQSLLFSDSLKDLKNLRTQLYSAAEYFELSYTNDGDTHSAVEVHTQSSSPATHYGLTHKQEKVPDLNRTRTVDVTQVAEEDEDIRGRERRMRQVKEKENERGPAVALNGTRRPPENGEKRRKTLFREERGERIFFLIKRENPIIQM